MRLFLALLAAIVLGACAHTSAANDASQALIGEGRHVAEVNCGRCHAIGRSGASPNPASPPFRMLSQHYPLGALDETFAEGVFVGHSDMPEFRLEPAQIEALSAYLRSVQTHASHDNRGQGGDAGEDSASLHRPMRFGSAGTN